MNYTQIGKEIQGIAFVSCTVVIDSRVYLRVCSIRKQSLALMTRYGNVEMKGPLIGC